MRELRVALLLNLQPERSKHQLSWWIAPRWPSGEAHGSCFRGTEASQNHGPSHPSRTPLSKCPSPKALPSCIQLLPCEWCNPLANLKLTFNGTKQKKQTRQTERRKQTRPTAESCVRGFERLRSHTRSSSGWRWSVCRPVPFRWLTPESFMNSAFPRYPAEYSNI